MPVKVAGLPVDSGIINSVFIFVSSFIFSIVILSLLLALTGLDLTTAFSGIVGCITNAGPGVGNIIGTFFGVLSLSTIKNIVSSLGLDEAWWTNITVAGMICLFLVIQSLVLSRKNKDS